MDIIISYWIKLSDEKWKTAEGLIKLRRYADSLFFCHLSLEALLKAAVVIKIKESAPLTHDLSKLAHISGLDFNEEQNEFLNEITTFNIKTRYDDYKYSFYKKATKSYAEKYFKIANNLRLWIKKNIHLKK